MLGRDSVLALLACVTRIQDGLSIVTEERKRTAAEQTAFENFSARVAAIDVTEVESATESTSVGLVAPRTKTTATLEEVRVAYCDTVMSVPHYEEEYNEPLTEHMAAEFGTDLAAIVSNNDVLTPPLQQALIQASQVARRDRASFQRTLASERDALTDARWQLRDIFETAETITTAPLDQRPFDGLVGAESRLNDLKNDCEEILQDRQQQLNEETSRDGVSLQEYLYTPHCWTYPVLSDALDCLSHLQEVEHRIARTVSRRL
jgi:hypothetical protein